MLMDAEVQALLDAFADLRERANANACFGEPVTAESRTVIPVAKVGYGFGMRAGQEAAAGGEAGDETGVGGGGFGGLRARPFAVVTVTPEDTWVEPIVDEQKLAIAGALLIGWVVICLARTLGKIFGQS
jgi:uncharacterized spore protein YtfJ